MCAAYSSTCSCAHHNLRWLGRPSQGLITCMMTSNLCQMQTLLQNSTPCHHHSLGSRHSSRDPSMSGSIQMPQRRLQRMTARSLSGCLRKSYMQQQWGWLKAMVQPTV